MAPDISIVNYFLYALYRKGHIKFDDRYFVLNFSILVIAGKPLVIG